jgi:hypothetical protein
MTELSLKKSGRRLEDHYDVIADGAVVGVGRITLFTTTPVELPWVWTIAPGNEEDRTQTGPLQPAKLPWRRLPGVGSGMSERLSAP